MISRPRKMTISCHDQGNYWQEVSLRAVAGAAAGDSLRIEVKRMDHTVYQQVIVTCTTMNTVYFVTYLVMFIAEKIRSRREKKKKEREKQAAQREAAAE